MTATLANAKLLWSTIKTIIYAKSNEKKFDLIVWLIKLGLKIITVAILQSVGKKSVCETENVCVCETENLRIFESLSGFCDHAGRWSFMAVHLSNS